MAADSGPAFVTGATGFLGRHLVRALLRGGREVFALVRSASGADDLRQQGVTLIEGDLLAVRPAMIPAGASVFHLAAVRQIPGALLHEALRINRDGSAALAGAAVAARAGRFLHVSTATVFGPSGGSAVDGGGEFTSFARNHPFLASRVAAIEEVDRIAGAGTDLVTLFPTIVFGPDHASHPNILTQQVRRLARSRLVPTFPGWSRKRNLVYVADVIDGLLAAEARAASGSRLILGGDDVRPEEFQSAVLHCMGRAAVPVPLPELLARGAARAADLFLRRRGSIGYSMRLEMLRSEWSFSSGRAEAEIAYRHLPFHEGIRRTVDHLRSGTT